MRTLSLLRHAKSDRDDPSAADFDRPLAPRGEKAAPLMGRHMRAIDLDPDLVLCSPAVRTRETAHLALTAMKNTAPVIFDEIIYEASSNALLERLKRVDPTVAHVLMIGHNPGLQDLTLALAGAHLSADFATLREKFPTGALVVLELRIDAWSKLGKGCGRVTHFATPRSLGKD